MARKLLVPLDLSSEEPPELLFAADLARALSAEIVLLHVVDYVPTLLPVDLPGGYPLPQIELVSEAAGKKLGRMVAKPDRRAVGDRGRRRGGADRRGRQTREGRPDRHRQPQPQGDRAARARKRRRPRRAHGVVSGDDRPRVEALAQRSFSISS
jgi:hypothetical protein